MGRIDGTTRELVPTQDFPRLKWEARAFIAVLVGVLGWAIARGSIVPLLFVGLPSFYGAWLAVFFGITQHAGLREDVLDHRLNTRTVYINPVFRFLYLNMNYHVEHHMFPAVPYYNLPALHREIKAYLPPPRPSMLAAVPRTFPRFARAAARPGMAAPRCRFPGRSLRDHGPTSWTNADGSATGGPRTAAGRRGRSEPLPAGADDVTAGEGTDLGPVSSFAVGEVRRVDHEGNTYALYRLGENEFALTDGLCTHAQTHLADGHLEGGIIECPKHNGRFDVRTGEAVRRPPRLPLCTYATEVQAGRVIGYLVPTLAAAMNEAVSNPAQEASGSLT